MDGRTERGGMDGMGPAKLKFMAAIALATATAAAAMKSAI